MAIFHVAMAVSFWNVMKSLAQKSRISARYKTDHPKMTTGIEVDRKTVSKMPLGSLAFITHLYH